MLSIAVVGCGQIGSRHLQALALIEQGATIYLVDQSIESIDLSRKRFFEVIDGNQEGRFKIINANINDIGTDLDIAIIATSSLNRASITKDFLASNTVKYIIFEKFLFQNRDDYDEIQLLLDNDSIKAWTNEWMCSTVAFQKIIKWVNSGSGIDILVSGNGFGLGCNAVHFIDILDYISNREVDFKNIETDLIRNVIKSKRQGFYEVNGKIELESGNSKLLIESKDKPSDGIIRFLFTSSDRSVAADFSLGLMKCTFKEVGQPDIREDLYVPPQSKMTQKIIFDILSSGRCGLPTYRRSAVHHKIILDVLDNHIRSNSDWGGSGCPIT